MKVSINLATYPAREKTLEPVVNNLLQQCDILRIYLNEYDYIPEYLKKSNIEIAYKLENIKDTGKFYWAETIKNEYYFTADDDIILPKNYTIDTIKAMKQHKVDICTIHGRILKKNAIDIDVSSVEAFYPLMSRNSQDRFVNYAGTGALCFDNRKIAIQRSLFQLNGFTDQFFAVAMQLLRKKILCRKHEGASFINYTESLWSKRDIETNNKILSQVKWRVM